MRLRIPGALPPATPMVRRDEPSRRPTASSGDAQTPPLPAGGAAVAARTSVGEPAADQWVRSREASTAPAAPVAPTVAPQDGVVFGAVTTGPEAAPEEAKLAAERVRQDVLARPPQASGVRGNLVAATVLNLLA